MNDKPDISVAIISYRHEKFVRQTLDGVAMQQFSGTMEIVIGDDLSPDGTRAILEEFAADYPNVKLLFHPRNLGMVGNWISVLDACTGRYVAVCEGDDFWTDPLKLQRQFDFMEYNPEYSMCWHPVEVLSEGVERPHPYAESKEVSDIHDIILNHFIPTCSLMFRNGLIPEWPEWIFKAMSFDIGIQLLIAIHGKVKRLDFLMASYRQHPEGISKTPEFMNHGTLRLLFILKKFNLYTKGAYNHSVRKKISEASALQLKILNSKGLKDYKMIVLFFSYRLYGVRANNFKKVRNEAYIYLIPKLYYYFKNITRC
jgi:glycosyltransferase involved in cell wall biosynthesis